MLNQIIWNNRFIRVNKSSVFFPGWNKVGIEKLYCLFDNQSNTLLTFTTFIQINGVHDEKQPQFTDSVTLVNEKIELQKYIAITKSNHHNIDFYHF